LSVNSNTVQFLQYGYLTTAATVSLRNGNTTIRLTPAADLAAYAYYTVSTPGGVLDAEGLPVSFVEYFNIGSALVGAPPTVVSIAPPGGYKGIGTNPVIQVNPS
jgi:hypothetical protein